MKWRPRYDSKEVLTVSLATGSVCDEPSKTQQSAAADADLNVLAKRFGLDKAVPPPQAYDPAYYGDVTDVPDLRTALDQVRDSRDKFMKLDARLRDRFNNDPARLWAFVNDPLNREEAVTLGLLAKRPQPPSGAPNNPQPTSTPTPNANGAPTAS